MTKKLNVLIASYLEPELIKKISEVSDQLNIIYDEKLIAPPRYSGDHTGKPFTRSEPDEQRWQSLLSLADIMFDFDRTHKADFPDLAPNVKWIQGTSTGIGGYIYPHNYDQRMPNTVFTVAGVHSRPLAEFCIMAMLMFFKNADRMFAQKKERRFERYSGTDLEGKSIGIVGLGRNGRKVAEFARCFGMHVMGTNLTPDYDSVDEYYSPDKLESMVSKSEVLVIALPETELTRNLISADVLAKLPKEALFINISRGVVVDEEALIQALNNGSIAGAALDVFRVEPLPADSPFWDMDNVILSPHSGSISDKENERICNVFCTNLKNYLEQKPLINVFDVKKRY